MLFSYTYAFSKVRQPSFSPGHFLSGLSVCSKHIPSTTSLYQAEPSSLMLLLLPLCSLSAPVSTWVQHFQVQLTFNFCVHFLTPLTGLPHFLLCYLPQINFKGLIVENPCLPARPLCNSGQGECYSETKEVLGRTRVITTWFIADGGENQKCISPILSPPVIFLWALKGRLAYLQLSALHICEHTTSYLSLLPSSPAELCLPIIPSDYL